VKGKGGGGEYSEDEQGSSSETRDVYCLKPIGPKEEDNSLSAEAN